MLVDSSVKVEIKVNNNQLAKYLELGYGKLKQGDTILVSLKDVALSNNVLVDVICDYCQTIQNIKYSSYNNSLKTNNKYCCKICKPIKYRETCLKKYGVDNIIKLIATHDKIRKTCLERYDNINYRNTELNKQTKFLKYGDEFFTNREKNKLTVIERFGVENCSQHPVVFAKQQKSRYTISQFRDTILNYQGSYEKHFLDLFYDKLEITAMTTIDYIYDNKNKVYFPDFYIPKYNLIVEIKSKFTYERYVEQNNSKRDQCIKDGYNFIFIINKDYNEFLKLYPV